MVPYIVGGCSLVCSSLLVAALSYRATSHPDNQIHAQLHELSLILDSKRVARRLRNAPPAPYISLLPHRAARRLSRLPNVLLLRTPRGLVSTRAA